MVPMFIGFWIIRVIASIILGFIQKDIYNSNDKDSYYYKGDRLFIYHKPLYFFIWMIPLIGWLYVIIRQFLSKDSSIFFND